MGPGDEAAGARRRLRFRSADAEAGAAGQEERRQARQGGERAYAHLGHGNTPFVGQRPVVGSPLRSAEVVPAGALPPSGPGPGCQRPPLLLVVLLLLVWREGP